MGYILDTSVSSPSIPHTVIRGETYYFQMRVPKQHQQLYGQSIRARLSECEEEARNLADHLSQLLKQTWQSNTKVKVCIDQALRSVRPDKLFRYDLQRLVLMEPLIEDVCGYPIAVSRRWHSGTLSRHPSGLPD